MTINHCAMVSSENYNVYRYKEHEYDKTGQSCIDDLFLKFFGNEVEVFFQGFTCPPLSATLVGSMQGHAAKFLLTLPICL